MRIGILAGVYLGIANPNVDVCTPNDFENLQTNDSFLALIQCSVEATGASPGDLCVSGLTGFSTLTEACKSSLTGISNLYATTGLLGTKDFCTTDDGINRRCLFKGLLGILPSAVTLETLRPVFSDACPASLVAEYDGYGGSPAMIKWMIGSAPNHPYFPGFLYYGSTIFG
jgi:hypothetical protein